jgi:anaerobic nitric oxide reductase transcription regulator
LNVYPLRVPPLRERGDDIALLGGYFCDVARRRIGTGPVRLDKSALDGLARYPWPGNVRELENVISRAVLRGSAAVPRGEPIVISGRHLAPELGGAELPPPAPLPAPADRPASLRTSAAAHKRALVAQALAAHPGNLAAAARALGMDRGNFHRLVKRLGLAIGL